MINAVAGDLVEVMDGRRSLGKFEVSRVTPTRIYLLGAMGEVSFDRESGNASNKILNNTRYIKASS